MTRGAFRWVGPGAFLFACSCENPEPSAQAATLHQQERPGYVLSSVAYELRVDRAGTTPLAEGPGFSVQNDRDLSFDIREMSVTSLSATLVPCDPRPPSTNQGASLREQLFGLPRAFAGHSDQADASEVHSPVFEDFIHDAPSRVFGTKTFPAARYCRVHYLVAPALGKSSLRIQGRVTNVDGTVSDLRVDTPFANGMLKELSEVTSGQGSAAHVTITRSIKDLFDGVQLEGKSEKEVSRALLKNLISQTRVSVALRAKP